MLFLAATLALADVSQFLNKRGQRVRGSVWRSLYLCSPAGWAEPQSVPTFSDYHQPWVAARTVMIQRLVLSGPLCGRACVLCVGRGLLRCRRVRVPGL